MQGTAQLSLFKGKRQKLPPAPEFSLHCMVADVLRRWCSPEWRWTHIPLGEYRTPATAARLKRMGVLPGWPDFQFFHVSGPVAFLELKRRGERLSDPQKGVAFHLMKAGHGYLVTDSFADAVAALRAWKIVPVSVSA